MTTESKKGYASSFEVDSHDHHLQSKIRILELTDSVRIGLTLVALLMGITVLGVSADALAVYDTTHVPQTFLLPLWPDQFNLRPTVALVVGSAIVVLANAVSLLSSKVQSVSQQVCRVLEDDIPQPANTPRSLAPQQSHSAHIPRLRSAPRRPDCGRHRHDLLLRRQRIRD